MHVSTGYNTFYRVGRFFRFWNSWLHVSLRKVLREDTHAGPIAGSSSWRLSFLFSRQTAFCKTVIVKTVMPLVG